MTIPSGEVLASRRPSRSEGQSHDVDLVAAQEEGLAAARRPDADRIFARAQPPRVCRRAPDGDQPGRLHHQRLAAARRPDAKRAVARRGEDAGAVGAEAGRVDAAGVAREDRRLAAAERPDTRGGVGPTRVSARVPSGLKTATVTRAAVAAQHLGVAASESATRGRPVA
jgi:hypothetical protein